MAHAGPRYKLMALEPPPWMCQSVAPWTLARAELWHDGELCVELRSAKATIPVALDLRDDQLVMTILDERVDRQRGASFVRALSARLSSRGELRPYLRALAQLARVSGGASENQELARDLGQDELAALLHLFRSYPAREGGPEAQIPALSPAARELTLGPEATAARILYGLARGDVREALEAWAALPPVQADAPFVRAHLELVALALLGRRREALEQLAALELRCDSAQRWLVLARVYEGLDAREQALAAHAQVIARRGDAWDRLRLARLRGDFEAGEVAPDAPAGAPESARESFVRELVKIFDAAGRLDDLLALLSDELDERREAGTLDEAPLEFVLRAASLHLWRGELEAARARLDVVRGRAGASARVALIEGACEVLAGAPEAGLAALETAEREGCAELSLLMWKAEALVALGRLEQAQACIDAHILRANSLVGYLMMLRVCALTQAPSELSASIATGTFLDGLVRDVLPELCTRAGITTFDAALEQPGRFAQLVTTLLARMAGNRSTRPTWLVPWLVPGSEPRLRLEPIVLPPTGREAAVANLVRIRSEPPEAVFAGFEALLDEFPQSPFPCTYRGELLIWLGRYDDALASFAQADTRGCTRWSYVGRAAAYDLLDEGERSDHWGSLGAEIFGELATATTHVYRGERLRKRGDWQRARADLEIAVRAKPRRIGARMNLALALRALGDEEGWTRELARLERDAPALLFEIGVRSGTPATPEQLEACLARMVGNRSSFLHTLIDAQGGAQQGAEAQVLRIVPNPAVWIGHARLCLSVYRDCLAQELAQRWLAQR